MKKTFILEDLDCAHCAALIEGDVAKLDGVTSSAVNLLSQKMVLECDEAKVSNPELITPSVRTMETVIPF